MDNEKSFVRLYFILITIASFLLMVVMMLSDNGIVKISCFLLQLVPAISIFLVKCERCGAILYRRTEKQHGIPIKGWEQALKEDCCPSCGIERYGFIQGVLNLVKG